MKVLEVVDKWFFSMNLAPFNDVELETSLNCQTSHMQIPDKKNNEGGYKLESPAADIFFEYR